MFAWLLPTLFSLQLSFMQWAVVCATVFIMEFMGYGPKQILERGTGISMIILMGMGMGSWN